MNPKDLIENLTTVEQKVIFRRYLEKKSLEEIAKELDLSSRERARQILARAEIELLTAFFKYIGHT